MGLSYDAQRNEFCAYVLHESQTPYGLLLGNFKTYAQSTAKGGVRGLWDADTDQIIFGTHHIAYRIGDRTFFPHQIERELTFLPVRANLRVHARPSHPRHRGLLRSVRLGIRPGGLVRRRRDALQPRRRRSGGRRLSLGDARRAALLRRARARGARVERRALHLFEESRDRRRALVGRIAPSGRGRALAARASSAQVDAPRHPREGSFDRARSTT